MAKNNGTYIHPIIMTVKFVSFNGIVTVAVMITAHLNIIIIIYIICIA